MRGRKNEQITSSATMLQTLGTQPLVAETIARNEIILAERDKAFTQIEADMKAINEMAADIAGMVLQQSEHIDLFDRHITNADQNIKKGNQELEQAAAYQSSRMCIVS